MAASLTTEIIYYNLTSDVELEFGLHGDYPLRLLSNHPNDYKSYLLTLKKAVTRNRIIIIVGRFGSKLTAMTAKAIGRDMKKVDCERYNIRSKATVYIPEKSLPLISPSGQLGGCIMESGQQSIIMLSDNSRLRTEIVQSLVNKYISAIYHANHPQISKPVQKEGPQQIHSKEPVKPHRKEELKNEPVNFDLLEKDIEAALKSVEDNPRRSTGEKIIMVLIIVELLCAAAFLVAHFLF